MKLKFIFEEAGEDHEIATSIENREEMETFLVMLAQYLEKQFPKQ